ncbi:helix-turn-helix domain-containing protein [Pontibacter sp. G13]|uniref:helix-turn-helix domain-containing protein n=1 Tax=Pontibacter sp. G13 TaxID=3074898 RepID=UPI0028898AB7|nr:helix-turn-helix domain-containing protein [Pontibacter sp. G13]WNJ17479.1 helix-turn-helix domain-containing protein [Pontibacter sp. G13]
MSYRIRLTTDQTYQLADLMQETQSKKLSRRLLALSLRHYGYPVHQIAKMIGVSEKTITNWMKQFLEGGFEGLLSLHYPKNKGSKVAPYLDRIQVWKETHPEGTLLELQAWLRDTHHLEVEYSWLYRYLVHHEVWELS